MSLSAGQESRTSAGRKAHRVLDVLVDDVLHVVGHLARRSSAARMRSARDGQGTAAAAASATRAPTRMTTLARGRFHAALIVISSFTTRKAECRTPSVRNPRGLAPPRHTPTRQTAPAAAAPRRGRVADLAVPSRAVSRSSRQAYAERERLPPFLEARVLDIDREHVFVTAPSREARPRGRP